jgi:hypothetical protein
MENNISSQKDVVLNVYSDYESEIEKLIKLRNKYEDVIARHYIMPKGDYDSEEIVECCEDGVQRLKTELNRKIIAYYDFHNHYLNSQYNFDIVAKDYSKYLWFGILSRNYSSNDIK